MKYAKQAIVIIFVLCLVLGSFSGIWAAEKRKPVIVPGKTFLPLRVLARPFSNIYKQADEKSPIVEENVPVFQSYFVYTRPKTSITGTKAEGWYEVGSDNRGTVLGWMRAEDVMEWKQAMCLAYEHPGGRKPVLMFDKLQPLQEMVKLPREERIKKAEEYYKKIETKQIPPDFPIISMEPKDAIDITEQFYLLPILEHTTIEIEGREGRLLKLASAPKSVRGNGNLKESAPVVTSDQGNNNSMPAGNDKAPGQVSANDITTARAGISDTEMLKKLSLDIVYVVDMTGSMGPYIQSTLQVIKGMTQKITQDAEIADSVKFGIWGYRDSTEIPGIEFDTKNFTPRLQDVKNFTKTLQGVRVAQVGSEGYDEDVFSGIDKAMRETNWTPDALHVMILVGDAPSHKPGHKWNLSGQSAETLRTFANDNKYYIFALHIKDPDAQQFWDLTEQQFRTLSKNKGVQESSYWSVPAKDIAEFSKVSGTIAGDLIAIIKEAKAGKVPSPQPPSATGSGMPGAGGGTTTTNQVSQKVRNLGYAALVEWIGKEKKVQAPRDIIAWVTDKDLIDPAIPSLDVRVLINKKQLDSLRTVLQEIMSAGRRGIIGGEKFFDALQAVPSVASRAGDQIRNAKNLAETGLVPEFMQDLPYQSQIMSMSNDLWASWSLDQQEEFLNEIDAKIQLYVAIHDEPQGWVALTQGDDPDEYVYPLSLEALP